MDAEQHRLAEQSEQVGLHPAQERDRVRGVDQVPEVGDQLGPRAAEPRIASRLSFTARRVRYIDDTFPDEEGARAHDEARGFEPLRERLALEVDLDAMKRRRRQLGGVSPRETFLAPRRGREVHLPDRAAAELLREAPGARVVAGAEHDDLLDATRCSPRPAPSSAPRIGSGRGFTTPPSAAASRSSMARWRQSTKVVSSAGVPAIGSGARRPESMP